MRTMAAQGYPATRIAIELGRTPEVIRRRCSALGIVLRNVHKRIWHRLRILIEPTIHRAIVLAARKRGMRAGELVRRCLTAVVVHNLYDSLLRAQDGPVVLPPLQPRFTPHRVDGRPKEIPVAVLRARDARLQQPDMRDLTSRLMGDPPPRRHPLGADTPGSPIWITTNALPERYLAGRLSAPQLVGSMH
jgi:hypothetical protein